MATKRQKKTVVTGVTREQAEDAFSRYAEADAEEEKITAELELAVVKLRESYSMELMTLKKDKEDAFGVLEAYAREQKDTLFSKKKSLEMAQGIIGFRTGTPKLKAKKGFTWAGVLTLVKEKLPGYVRLTEEVAKDKLLADRDGEVAHFSGNPPSGEPSGGVTGTGTRTMRDAMAECGIEVVQDETFYVERKKEEVENRE